MLREDGRYSEKRHTTNAQVLQEGVMVPSLSIRMKEVPQHGVRRHSPTRERKIKLVLPSVHIKNLMALFTSVNPVNPGAFAKFQL